MKRSYCNYSHKLGRALINRKSDLNKVKSNTQLIQFLKSLDRKNLDVEANNYLDELICEVTGGNFLKNFQFVYNIVLAGEGLKVIR